MGVAVSDTMIRRLRAHKLVPERELVQLVSGGALARHQDRLQWEAVHPVSGQSYRVASRFPMRALAGARQWAFRRDGELVLVEPDEQEQP